MITKMLDLWAIEKTRVHAVVRDNAANMVAGIHKAELPAIGCTIYSLYLVIKDCMMTQHDHLVEQRRAISLNNSVLSFCIDYV